MGVSWKCVQIIVFEYLNCDKINAQQDWIEEKNWIDDELEITGTCMQSAHRLFSFCSAFQEKGYLNMLFLSLEGELCENIKNKIFISL